MDYDKLIRRLRNDADAYRNGKTLGRAFADQEDVLDNAATALSTLHGENEKLRAENIRWGQVASEQDKAIDNLRKELEWKDKVIELAQRKEREAKAELERLKNCRHECKIECLLEEYNRVVAELKQLKGS